MKWIAVFVFFSLIIFLFLFKESAFAQEPSNILINEFAAVTEGTSANPDWVELYNPGSDIVSLDGWVIKDATETNKIALALFICPGTTRKFNFSNRLNNSGDKIRLFNGSGALADSVEYFSAEIPIHQKGESTGRETDGTSSWKVFSTPTPTDSPCKTSGITTPTPGSNLKVSLSEFFPNPPTGEKEWVELFNPNSVAVDLTGWKIDDIDGGSSPFSVPEGTVINGNSFKVFYFSSKFNNSGDSIRLLNQDGKVVETFTFKEVDKEVSYAKDKGGTWQQTTTPTPGKENKIIGFSSSTKTNQGSGRTGSDFSFREGPNSSFSLDPGQLLGTSTYNQTAANTDKPVESSLVKSSSNKNNYSLALIGLGIIFIGAGGIAPFIRREKLVK